MHRVTASAHRVARQVAHAAGTFEHLLLGRAPTGVTVVVHGDWMVVSLHEPFTAAERRMTRDAEGAARAAGLPTEEGEAVGGRRLFG